VHEGKDIVLVIDYHAENIESRWFNEATGEERTCKYPTTRAGILRQVEDSIGELAPGGKVVWVMESTTGWARVKDLLGDRVKFVLANVLQMPLPPKGRRRKTDKIDTARLLREYLNGQLPRSFQPSAWWREVRRVVDCRQDLVERQTAIKNWIGALLHHETWEDRENLWTGAGLSRLGAMKLSQSDKEVAGWKLKQLEQIQELIKSVEKRLQVIYDAWPEAQWVDAVRGIGMVTAVSLLAHIGPIQRFPTAEDLIGYAGLAPGVRTSDNTTRHGRIGGDGTDSHLRYMLIEATTWLCQIPRYKPTYERVMKKRGKKIARIVVARLLLRSVHKMLKDRIRFNPMPAVRREVTTRSENAFIASGLPAEKEKAPMLSEPSPLYSRRLGARVARQRCPILPAGQ
jgi:transposase